MMFLLKIFVCLIIIGLGILGLMLLAYLGILLKNAIKDEIDDNHRH